MAGTGQNGTLKRRSEMDMEQPADDGRRQFILSVLLGGIGVILAGGAGWSIWGYLAPPAGKGEKSKIRLARNLAPVGAAHFFQFRGHPAVVLQVAPGKFHAFSAICTHLGCIVQWVSGRQEFLCPCHGGRYDADGRVLGGPPPKPLEVIPVAVAGEELVVG